MNTAQIAVLNLLKQETEIEIDQLYKRVEGLKASDLDQLSDLMLIKTTGYWQDNDAKGYAPLYIHITNSGRIAEIQTDPEPQGGEFWGEYLSYKQRAWDSGSVEQGYTEWLEGRSKTQAQRIVALEAERDALKQERDEFLVSMAELYDSYRNTLMYREEWRWSSQEVGMAQTRTMNRIHDLLSGNGWHVTADDDGYLDVRNEERNIKIKYGRRSL